MKTFLLLCTITLGVFFPYGHEYTYLIRYFLMTMLFFSFLEIKFKKEVFEKIHLVILLAIILSSLAVYFILKPFNLILAQTAFITSIAPTAIAAPVIIGLKRGKVEFVTFSLLLNNIVIALLIPFLIPLLMNSGAQISAWKILLPVLYILSVPMALAQLIKLLLPKIWSLLVGWKDSAFYILVMNIYIATSEASHYIQSELMNNLTVVFLIAATSIILCIFFFSFGWFLGGKNFAPEASQSLGQKNNAFTIWLSLTFVSPIAVLGPIFYVFIQNIYISWELYRHNSVIKSGQ